MPARTSARGTSAPAAIIGVPPRMGGREPRGTRT
jgi:hypothetical protein